MPDIPYVPSFVEQAVANTIEDVPVALIRQGIYIVEGGGDIFSGNFSEGADDIWEGSKTIVTGTARSAADLVTSNPVTQGVKALASDMFGWP